MALSGVESATAMPSTTVTAVAGCAATLCRVDPGCRGLHLLMDVQQGKGVEMVDEMCSLGTTIRARLLG